MDWESGRGKLTGYITKYRYFILILLAGVMMLVLPDQPEASIPQQSAEEEIRPDLQEQLEDILEKIAGVGKVKVLLTEASGSNTLYQVDENRNQSDLDTVIVMNSQRDETGLVKQVIPPQYRGAVIVCQGADRAGVRLAVVDAVKRVTGLSSDCIAVLKMK